MIEVRGKFLLLIPKKKKNNLQQQPKEPHLEVDIAQHLVGPVAALHRHALGLLLAEGAVAEEADALEPLVTLETEGDVVDPRFEPLVVPLTEDGELVDEAAALEEGVEAAREGIAVDVEQVLVLPGGLLVGVRFDGEELLLGVTVAGVALAHVGE